MQGRMENHPGGHRQKTGVQGKLRPPPLLAFLWEKQDRAGKWLGLATINNSKGPWTIGMVL